MGRVKALAGSAVDVLEAEAALAPEIRHGLRDLRFKGSGRGPG